MKKEKRAERMEKKNPLPKKRIVIKDYHWLFMAAFLVLLMAVLEKRVRVFYVLATFLFGLGFLCWIYSDIKSKKGVKR